MNTKYSHYFHKFKFISWKPNCLQVKHSRELHFNLFDEAIIRKRKLMRNFIFSNQWHSQINYMPILFSADNNHIHCTAPANLQDYVNIFSTISSMYYSNNT